MALVLFQKSLFGIYYVGLEAEILEVTKEGRCFDTLDKAIKRDPLTDDDIEMLIRIRHIFSQY